MSRYLWYSSAVIIVVLIIFLFWKNDADPYTDDEMILSQGKKLFTTHCISCHGLEEDGIGPRLGGITSLLSEKDLMNFIRNPEKVITSGNERAGALHAKYKQTMPSFEWLDDEAIHSLLSYIHQQTVTYKIQTLTVSNIDNPEAGLTGRLVAPVKKTGLKIELEDYVQIPRLPYSTPDLGIVTMRPNPSGDGRIYISDQGGIIYVIDNGKADIFLDLRTHIPDFSIGPGIATGLGSFDFHPDFLNNGLLYITHAEKYSGQRADYRTSDSLMAEVQWVLSEWKVEDVDARKFTGTRREMLRLHAPTFGHGAQDIGFIPDLSKEHLEYGFLYWGFGDGGSNNVRRPELGHNLTSFLGTILRIDPAGNNSPNGKYGIPPDNPFAGDTASFTLKEIFAYGFRNPHRMSWDTGNHNRMLVTDIGESNIEEINIVEKGGDYGWPGREGDFGIATKKDLKTVYKLAASDLDLYKRPFLQYDHIDGFAVSGGYIYEGELADLKGKYIFGDIVNGKLFYANVDKLLTDSTVYELTIIQNGSETTLREMSGAKRLHLRIAYDRFRKQLYVITKVDGMIRRVAKATF